MKRRSFFKSFAALLGVAIVAPLELFGESERKSVADIKLPDWVKYISVKRTKGDRISFIQNGDGAFYDAPANHEQTTHPLINLLNKNQIS